MIKEQDYVALEEAADNILNWAADGAGANEVTIKRGPPENEEHASVDVTLKYTNYYGGKPVVIELSMELDKEGDARLITGTEEEDYTTDHADVWRYLFLECLDILNKERSNG